MMRSIRNAITAQQPLALILMPLASDDTGRGELYAFDFRQAISGLHYAASPRPTIARHREMRLPRDIDSMALRHFFTHEDIII